MVQTARIMGLLQSLTLLLMGMAACGNPEELDPYSEWQFAASDTASIASGLEDVCIRPQGDVLYITSPSRNAVYAVNTGDLAVIDSIPVEDPRGVCVLPAGDMAYASSSSGNSVIAIRTSDNTVAAIIPVGKLPIGLCALPGGDYVYVANSGDSSITAIRTLDNQAVATIPCYPGPFATCSDPTGEYVFCTLSNITGAEGDSSGLVSIRTSDNSVVDEAFVGQDFRGVSSRFFEEGQTQLFVVDHDQDMLLVYDADPLIYGESYDFIGEAPLDICTHPSEQLVLATNSGSNSVSAYFFNQEVMDTYQVEGTPTGICTDQSGEHVYVVHDSGALVVLEQK